MFEKIHFRHMKFEHPMTNHNYIYSIARQWEDSERVLDQSKGELQGEFLVDGSTDSCIPYHVSDYAKENLFYINTFTVLHNKKQYFTRRKNMGTYLLSITYEGSGELEYEGKKFKITPGFCFLIDCNKPHYYKTENDIWTHADLHFDGAFTDKIINEFNANEEYVLPWAKESGLQQQLEELLDTYDNVVPYRELLISNQLENLLISLLKLSSTWHRVYKNIPENLREVIRYIEIHYMDHLTLDFLAEFAGMNKYYLIRLFNKYLGVSPKEYIITLQLSAAKKLLKDTTLPANKIAVMVGIENENHFRHLFKEREGVSPGEYRKNK